MNADQLIARARSATDKLYQDDNTPGKKNFHIGFLESTIRELVYVIQDLEGKVFFSFRQRLSHADYRRKSGSQRSL